jgi:hypothetical protein
VVELVVVRERAYWFREEKEASIRFIVVVFLHREVVWGLLEMQKEK